jgi:hypothetical protein
VRANKSLVRIELWRALTARLAFCLWESGSSGQPVPWKNEVVCCASEVVVSKTSSGQIWQ